MSLTSVLSTTNNQELRDRFKSDFARPEFKVKGDLKAPPRTKNWGTVGTAFDYLFRFQLQYLNHHVSIQNSTWVADMAYKRLMGVLMTCGTDEIELAQEKKYRTNELIEILATQYDQSKANFKEYLENGILTDEFISNSIFLAKLDSYFRSGIIDQNIDLHDPEDIEDLKSLCMLIDKDSFKVKHRCYLNPTFGLGSQMVKGADADLILDNVLIDIKVTKHLKLEREHLNQIIGYYILSLIGGVNENPHDKPIDTIGIYFARYGALWVVPVKELGTAAQFEAFKEWFISYLMKTP
jgi:hypothetical protein